MINKDEIFYLQWHLSEACNLKCLHCYQENKEIVNLNKGQLFNILDQYKNLLKELGVKGHINLTGGEPLCSPYFFDILEQFKKDSNLYSFCILTNGTLINDEIAKKISEYSPKYVQVSLEGGKRINDYVRGEGVYNKVASALKFLRKYGIYTSISFTSTKLNYKEFPKVVEFGIKNHASAIWSDRFIPVKSNNVKNIYNETDKQKVIRNNEFLMDSKELQEFLEIMYKEKEKIEKKQNKLNVKFYNKYKEFVDLYNSGKIYKRHSMEFYKDKYGYRLPEIKMHRALQFTKTNEMPYHCTAGNSLLTVMENGDLVPCRRMPIIVGNLLKDDMLYLYKNNKVLLDLQKQEIPKDCLKCNYFKSCLGGLKCLNYAVKGNYNIKDINCIF